MQSRARKLNQEQPHTRALDHVRPREIDRRNSKNYKSLAEMLQRPGIVDLASPSESDSPNDPATRQRSPRRTTYIVSAIELR